MLIENQLVITGESQQIREIYKRVFRSGKGFSLEDISPQTSIFLRENASRLEKLAPWVYTDSVSQEYDPAGDGLYQTRRYIRLEQTPSQHQFLLGILKNAGFVLRWHRDSGCPVPEKLWHSRRVNWGTSYDVVWDGELRVGKMQLIVNYSSYLEVPDRAIMRLSEMFPECDISGTSAIPETNLGADYGIKYFVRKVRDSHPLRECRHEFVWDDSLLTLPDAITIMRNTYRRGPINRGLQFLRFT